jgi:hypothetical protein
MASRPPFTRAVFKNALKIRVSKIYVVKMVEPKICNGKTNGFFTFLLFLHFGTRILTKNATWFYKNILLDLIYKGFARKHS